MDRNTASALHASSAVLRERAERSLPMLSDSIPASAGVETSRRKARTPKRASPLTRTSQRMNGSRGDWRSGCSAMGADADSGSPTENRNAPRTRWPSTVDTFVQATVYVPLSSVPTDTDMTVGSLESSALSPRSISLPRESSTRISLSAGSSGSVKRMVTRSGGASSTELGAGSDSARFACAAARPGVRANSVTSRIIGATRVILRVSPHSRYCVGHLTLSVDQSRPVSPRK